VCRSTVEDDIDHLTHIAPHQFDHTSGRMLDFIISSGTVPGAIAPELAGQVL
jgi:hypothetical protein